MYILTPPVKYDLEGLEGGITTTHPLNASILEPKHRLEFWQTWPLLAVLWRYQQLDYLFYNTWGISHLLVPMVLWRYQHLGHLSYNTLGISHLILLATWGSVHEPQYDWSCYVQLAYSPPWLCFDYHYTLLVTPSKVQVHRLSYETKLLP